MANSAKFPCSNCQQANALKALLIEALPSIEQHANKRRRGVTKFRQLGNPREFAELRLNYLDSLATRIRSATLSAADEDFILMPRALMVKIISTLTHYADDKTFLPQKVEGLTRVLAPAPPPEKLAALARTTLQVVQRDLFGEVASGDRPGQT